MDFSNIFLHLADVLPPGDQAPLALVTAISAPYHYLAIIWAIAPVFMPGCRV